MRQSKILEKVVQFIGPSGPKCYVHVDVACSNSYDADLFLEFDRNDGDSNSAYIESTESIKQTGIWSSVVHDPSGQQFSYPVLAVLHILTDGPCCFIWPSKAASQRERDEYSTIHSRCQDLNQALRVQSRRPLEPVDDRSLGDGAERPPLLEPAFPEFLLAPVRGIQGQSIDVPLFAVFPTDAVSANFVLCNVLKPKRLPVVFDLDETLIKAYMLSSLERESKKVAESISAENQMSAQNKKLMLHERKVKEDIAKLASFKKNDGLNGKKALVQVDRCTNMIGQEVHEKRLVFFVSPYEVMVRMRPEEPQFDTNILFKIRPNWWPALASITKSETAYVTVCTTAVKRDYATEVWRMVDPEGFLIPSNQRGSRLLSGVEGKYLARAFNLIPYPYRPEIKAIRSSMPLALIIDDRKDVWEPGIDPPYTSAASRQVFCVKPFTYYDEAISAELENKKFENSKSGKEMIRVPYIISKLREKMFLALEKAISHLDKATIKERLPIEDLFGSYRMLLGDAPWVERLLDRTLSEVPEPLEAPNDQSLPVCVVSALISIQGLLQHLPPIRPGPPTDPRQAVRPMTSVNAVQRNQALSSTLGKPTSRPMTSVNSISQPQDSTRGTSDWTQKWNESFSKSRTETENPPMSDVIDPTLKMNAPSLGDKSKAQGEDVSFPSSNSKQLTKNDPVVLLSQHAQKNSCHLSYSYFRLGEGEWGVQILYKPIDEGNRMVTVTAKGNSIDGARFLAASNILQDLGLNTSLIPRDTKQRKQVSNSDDKRSALIALLGPPQTSATIGRETAVQKLHEHMALIGARMNAKPPVENESRYRSEIVITLKDGHQQIVSEGEAQFPKWSKQVACLKLLNEIGYKVDWTKPPAKGASNPDNLAPSNKRKLPNKHQKSGPKKGPRLSTYDKKTRKRKQN